MKPPIKVAILGYGSVAEKIHAPLISVCPDLELVAVLERNGNRCGEKYPEVRTFRNLNNLLDADLAELIVITTPNEYHFSMAKQCLLAGKHVVVDKPVTVFSSEAQELKSIASERNLICSVFQNRRFDGDFLTLQKLIGEGILGEIAYIESHFDRFRPHVSENWRERDVPGNGITYDLGAHLIDQMVLLFGLPNWIQADIRSQRALAVADDHFDIVMDYGKTKVRVTAGVMVNVQTPKFLVLGSNGSYQKLGLDVQEAALKSGRIPEGEEWGQEAEEKWGKIFHNDTITPYPTLPGNYRIFYQNVADAIQNGANLEVTLAQAISTLQLIESSFLSSEFGKRVYRKDGAW